MRYECVIRGAGYNESVFLPHELPSFIGSNVKTSDTAVEGDEI
jgi:hypothetical protein